MSTNKDDILENVLKQIDKQFGKGTVIELGAKANYDTETISSGSFILDRALGIGGFPKGRIVEIYGPESSGKTTLALLAIAQAQQKGLKVAFIDAEHAIDPKYAKSLGVDPAKLLLSQPDSGEDALDVAEMLISSNAIGLIVIDSVAALVPKVELEGEMSDVTMGAQARLMSKALRKILGAINKSNCVVIFINQVREKIGVFYGNPETTPGGKALKFYASIRLDVRAKEKIMDQDRAIGQVMKIKVVKNKMAAPYQIANVAFYFDHGINLVDEIFDLAVETEIIAKSGSWYSYKENKLGQGRKASIEAINKLELLSEIKTLVEEKLNQVN